MAKSKLEVLEEKKEQLVNRIQKMRAAEKHKESKKDTRRKILYGALVLELLKRGDPLGKSIEARLDGYLTRENDRKLFALSPLFEKKTENKATETA